MVGLTLTGVPLVAAMLPGVITPGPPLNAGIKLELDPASMVEGLPAKPLISGGGPVLVVELPLPQPAKSKTATVAISATITDAAFRFMTASICPTELDVMDGTAQSRADPDRQQPRKRTLLAKTLVKRPPFRERILALCWHCSK